MSLWIPLFTEYPNHPKTVRLRRLLKLPTADAYPVRLWLWCAVHYPDGKPDLDLLEEAVGWKPQDGRLVAALKEARFIDPDTLSLHGWAGRAGATLQRIEQRRRADRARKSASAPSEFQRNSVGIPAELQRSSNGVPSETSPQTEKENEKEMYIQHPHAPASGGGSVGGEAPKKKRTGIRRKKRPEDYPAAVHDFVRQFREDFRDNVQADYDFGELAVSELRAASRLLKEATREQLSLEMRYFMADKRDAGPGEFPGWALVILSVANWREKRDKIRASMLRDGVL